MTVRSRVLLLVGLLALVGCAAPEPEETPPTAGREVVERMIAAHGGLEKWRSSTDPPLPIPPPPHELPGVEPSC